MERFVLTSLGRRWRRCTGQAVALGRCLAGMAGGAWCNSPATPAQRARGLVLMMPGVEGRAWQLGGMIAGLRDAGLDHAVDVAEWADYPFSSLENLRNLPRNRARAAALAERITLHRTTFPNSPVTLIGYSGGGGLALMTAERLAPDVYVDRMILMAPAISTGFDVAPALSRCRAGIVHFYSPGDWFMVGLCTRLFGTLDRVRSDSAGRVGFRNGDGGLCEHSGLTQIAYDPAWMRLDHDGGHFGWLARRWAREVLASTLLPSPQKHIASSPRDTEPAAGS